MSAQPFVVSPQDRTQSLRVVGEHITVASAAQTFSYEIFFQAGPEGSGSTLPLLSNAAHKFTWLLQQ
jgi:hypothetical protein